MESVTGLSEAAWLVGEDCDEVALSPLPPQATSSSAGTSASITYDAARGVEIRFVMEDSCMGCARGAVSRTDCLQSVLQCTAARHIEVMPLDRAGERPPPATADRKRVGQRKSGSVSVDIGGRHIIKKKQKKT